VRPQNRSHGQTESPIKNILFFSYLKPIFDPQPYYKIGYHIVKKNTNGSFGRLLVKIIIIIHTSFVPTSNLKITIYIHYNILNKETRHLFVLTTRWSAATYIVFPTTSLSKTLAGSFFTSIDIMVL